MTRISVETRDGRSFWFDTQAAQACSWKESSHPGGHNFVSDVTGSQWEHEHLHRTAKGAWVLHSWSQWQGSRETYRQITPTEAAAWLIQCGYERAVEQYLPGLSCEGARFGVSAQSPASRTQIETTEAIKARLTTGDQK